MRLFDLTGKVALVTGGNGGIGLGMARGLAEAGAAIAVAGRDSEKSKRAAAELTQMGVRAAPFEVEVGDEAKVRRLVADVCAWGGGIDVVVNAAGINVRRAPDVATTEEWRTVLDTNLTGAFLVAREAHPHLRERGGGKIIHVGSMFSLFGGAQMAAYAASKGGLVALAKSQAVAWARDRIGVNVVLPGYIDTALFARARADIPGLGERVLTRTPAGRFGTPEDAAGIAVFLASAASDFVTGAVIALDGGYSAQG